MPTRLILFALLFNLNSTFLSSQTDYTQLVNPLMGTDSEFSLSNGNTYPAIARPWGMNFWAPMTAEYGNGWFYAYDSYKINGFRQTHQPSPWINDYAAFSIMPVTGGPKFQREERASWFSHKTETALPHHYKVYLADHDVTAEMTPTERAAIMRFTFPKTEQAYVILDAFPKGSMVKILPDEQKIIGYCRNNSGGVPENFHNYFVLEFDQPFTGASAWRDSVRLRGLEVEADHVGALVHFDTRENQVVEVRVASSFIDLEQAERNLARELGERSFETVLEEGKQVWNKELGRIQVKGKNQDHIRTFYSCLYRLLLFPRKFYEYDAEGAVVHYSPYNGKVLPGYMFTDNGFWDTFRAVFPFFTLMYPELNSQIMQGLVNTYEESGWLPEWASPGHRDCMIGSNSASLIADAYLKGIRGYDIEKLYEAMVKNTEGHGPVYSVGRYGAQYYNELGYVPYDVGINENAARTLEYAYADYCLWQLSKAMGKSAEEQNFHRQRAYNYRQLFRKDYKLMSGRNKDGSFPENFSPYKWGDAFTEGNAWHYTWSVFHNISDLSDLMGGEAAFAKMLDSVFVVPPIFDNSYYGFTIHEIREMQIAGMGNYAHGNQPIQHMIYLYNYADQPWKAQYRAREVLTKLYNYTADGYCGDEDNGQTSAWYVFSALGFYPVCPGTDEYVIGSPLFDEVKMTMPNGQSLRIEARNNVPDHPFIQAASVNGQPWDKNYFKHAQLQVGGEIIFQMGPQPNELRGVGEENRPYSMGN